MPAFHRNLGQPIPSQLLALGVLNQYVLIAAGTAFHHGREPSGFVRICHDRPEAFLTAAMTRLKSAFT